MLGQTNLFNPSQRSKGTLMRRLSFGVLLIALSTLILELMLTRVFDVTLTPNLSYFVVSLAVFSFGLAGIYATLRPIPVEGEIRGRLVGCSVGFAVAVLLLQPIINSLRLDYTMVGRYPVSTLASFAALYVTLLVPFFLAGIGLHFDTAAFTTPSTLALAALILGAAIVSKFLACGLAALRMGRSDAVRIGVGMIPRGEVGMVVAQIGLNMRVMSESVYGIIVFMSVATTLVAPPLLKLAFRGERPSANEEVLRLG